MNKEGKKIKYIILLSFLIVIYLLLAEYILKFNLNALMIYSIIGVMTLILSIITANIFKNYLFKDETFKAITEIISLIEDFFDLLAITYLLLDKTPIRIEDSKNFVLVYLCIKLFAFVFNILDADIVRKYNEKKLNKKNERCEN